MSKRRGAAARWVGGTAAVLALGFGAGQALAAPAASSAPAAACHPDRCHQGCVWIGFETGRCIEGMCHCYVIT